MCAHVRVSRCPKLSNSLSVQDTASSAHPSESGHQPEQIRCKRSLVSFKILGLQFGAIVLGADLLVGGSSLGILRIIAFSLNSLSVSQKLCMQVIALTVKGMREQVPFQRHKAPNGQSHQAPRSLW